MQIEKEICSNGEAGLDDDALGAAKRAFGISYLYPWQRLVIANIIDAYRSRKTETNDAGAAEADGITSDAKNIINDADNEDAAEYGKHLSPSRAHGRSKAAYGRRKDRQCYVPWKSKRRRA